MTDAELLEEERKKKEAAAMGEVQPQKPITFRDYNVPESPRGSGLSVFTPSGEVKPGVDVSAITSAPETLPKPSEVNTALNKEVQVGSPSVDESGYFQKLKEFGQSVFGRDQGLFDVDRLGKGADNLLGSAMRNLTPVEDRRFANNEPFGKTFTDTFDITKADGTKFYPDKVAPQTGDAQAATGASASDVTPSVTPTVETPSGGAQGQAGAVQSPFLQSPDTPSGLGGPLLRGFNMVNDASRPPNAPMGQEATQAALGGRTLNEYLNAPAGTEGVSGLRTDPQGRMIPSGFETRAEAFPDYEDQAAAREARLAARPDFGDAVSDRDRRAARGEGISMADRTAMAKANARGASPSEIARGNKIADELGVDLETGQPLQPTGGLTFEQKLAQDKFELEETKFIQSIIDNANAKTPLSPAQKKFAEEAGKGAYSWDQGGRQTSQENIGKFGQIIQDLEQGQLDTRTLSEFVPFGGDWWRSALNPTGQQGLDNVRGVIFQGLRDTLGAQFTEKEGERLVNAAYNPKLSEEQNIARLKPALARMKATFQAKEALTKHIMDGGDVRDYKGKTPMDVYKSFDGQAGSGSPIPGDVDVNIQDNAQAILDRQ